MEWYTLWVSENVLFSAFIQFAILGSAGEALGTIASKRKPSGTPLEWLAKALAWGILGILIKYAFTGYKGFLAILVDHGFLPSALVDVTVLRALSLSLLANSMFGPLLMVLHRTSDNLIAHTKGYAGLEKSLATLAWFWVPAHTVTFALPPDYQVGLAALWSVALGLIMGFTKRAS
ncbi:MAG: hypothetical protein JXM71_03390 [Spirochaetales bacterium]|nr:hypothetical protein [Spirochaetales bacterium]